MKIKEKESEKIYKKRKMIYKKSKNYENKR